MGVLENNDELGRLVATHPCWDEVRKIVEKGLGSSGFSILSRVETRSRSVKLRSSNTRPNQHLFGESTSTAAIDISALPKPGHLASEVTSPLMPKIKEFERNLPTGYRLEIVGELKEQIKGQLQSLTVVVASVLAIYLALVFQFNNAFKPLIVFAGIPFGAVGALGGVWLMNMPIGFMVILGITSLIGIIVSHVIVLFEFIEDRHEHGEALREALIDARILRIRPVLITVGATVLALFPLALHAGPLWEALCYGQIGGLTVATTVTLFIVPVFYSIFVLDLKIIRWEERGQVARKAEVATAPPIVCSTTAPASA